MKCFALAIVLFGIPALAAEHRSEATRPRDNVDTHLLFLPTAVMLPKGDFETRSYELAYLSMNTAPGSTTNISVGSLLGLAWTLGLRQQVWSDSDKRTAVALGVWGMISFTGPTLALPSASATLSRRFSIPGTAVEWSLHTTAGHAGWLNGVAYYGMGIVTHSFHGVSGILEYASPSHPMGTLFFIDLASDNAVSKPGFFNTGLQYRAESFYAKVAVMQTMAAVPEEAARLFIVPLLVFGYRF